MMTAEIESPPTSKKTSLKKVKDKKNLKLKKKKEKKKREKENLKS